MYPYYKRERPIFTVVKNPSAIKAFGLQLRRLREDKTLSQQELADLSDIAKITVQRIENAKFVVTLDVLVSLANGLNMPLSQLLDFTYPVDKQG